MRWETVRFCYSRRTAGGFAGTMAGMTGAAGITTEETRRTAAARVDGLDAWRGLVMVLMAIDHLREFLHADAFRFSPEDLSKTTPFLFSTRWMTHFCAPVFMFAAGLSAWLVGRRLGRDGLSRFLVKRGLWLIVLELVVVRLAFGFRLGEGLVVLSVLWALGWSMIVLAGLIRLPVRVLAVASVAVILLHNLLDGVRPEMFGAWGWVWNLLHQPGVFPAGAPVVLAAYPLIPWFAVMAAGYCFGAVIEMEPAVRRRWMMRIGLACVAGFVALRLVNGYGNPAPWRAQESGAMTVVAFLNVLKYPPSLDFLLMTLGPALLVLAWFDRLRWPEAHPLVVFGRVPLFYFLLHLYLIHLTAVALGFARYGSGSFLLHPLPSMGGPADVLPAGYGYPLWVVYLIWALLVAGLYPVCRWWAGVKRTRREWWVRYL